MSTYRLTNLVDSISDLSVPGKVDMWAPAVNVCVPPSDSQATSGYVDAWVRIYLQVGTCR